MRAYYHGLIVDIVLTFPNYTLIRYNERSFIVPSAELVVLSTCQALAKRMVA